MNNIKKHFPLLNKYKNLIYLDNAATTQKPDVMLSALNEYYTSFNSNIGRSVYNLANLSEKCFVDSKKIIANFIGCKKNNIIYTNGCTDSLNIAAYLAKQKIQKKYIILPISEHHANVLIWQRIAQENNFKLYWISEPELILNPNNIELDVLENTAIMALAHVSNVTGEIYPVEKWCKTAKEIGAISIVDGAQAVTSLRINLFQIDCDFYAFSAHKLYGPMGLGVLFVNDKFLDTIPLKLGGGIVEDVKQEYYILLEDITRFEAGTPNIANAYAFSKTIEFLNNNNWEQLLDNIHKLSTKLSEELINIGITPLSISNSFKKTHINSFVLPKIHSHDVGTFLDKKNIAIRVGKHCAHPLHSHLKINSSIRASLGIYNDENDITMFIKAIKECIHYFN